MSISIEKEAQFYSTFLHYSYIWTLATVLLSNQWLALFCKKRGKREQRARFFAASKVFELFGWRHSAFLWSKFASGAITTLLASRWLGRRVARHKQLHWHKLLCLPPPQPSTNRTAATSEWLPLHANGCLSERHSSKLCLEFVGQSRMADWHQQQTEAPAFRTLRKSSKKSNNCIARFANQLKKACVRSPQQAFVCQRNGRLATILIYTTRVVLVCFHQMHSRSCESIIQDIKGSGNFRIFECRQRYSFLWLRLATCDLNKGTSCKLKKKFITIA